MSTEIHPPKPRFRLLGHQNTSLRMAQLRVTVPVAACSAMFNNGPLVAMLVPLVQAWALRHGHHAAQLLMPGIWHGELGMDVLFFSHAEVDGDG